MVNDLKKSTGEEVPDLRNTGLRKFAGYPFSGNERNHLFLNRGGEQFLDVSGVTGLDSLGDGRSFASLDINRDGLTDFVVRARNTPRTLLLENRLTQGQNNFLAVQVEGGNHRSESSGNWSNRDGIGVKLILEVGERLIHREIQRGKGLAAQNSSTAVIGLGKANKVERLTVLWPSGKKQMYSDLPVGKLASISERSKAPTPKFSTYSLRDTKARQEEGASSVPLFPEFKRKSGVTVLTTMATWCESCKEHLPQLSALRKGFDDEAVGLVGVPADEKESRKSLEAYVENYSPAYELAYNLSPAVVQRLKNALRESVGEIVLPSSLILDKDGRLLKCTLGLPTVSQLRGSLDRASGSSK